MEGFEGLNSFLMLTMQQSMNLSSEYAMFNQNFLSFESGYYPYNMDKEEVLRMSEYMQNLEIALKCYEEEQVQVDFEHGNMFHVVLQEDKRILSCGEMPLPFTAFQFGNLLITDEELLSDLAKVPKCNAVLEADVSVLGASVSDKKYERPANSALSLLGDANTGPSSSLRCWNRRMMP